MFRVVSPPIIRSTHNCIYSIWYLSTRYCYLPLSRQVAVAVWQVTDAVNTVVCAPDDEWRYHPKHVEQFPGINKLCNVACCWIYILEYTYIPLKNVNKIILTSNSDSDGWTPLIQKPNTVLYYVDPPLILVACEVWLLNTESARAAPDFNRWSRK